MSRDASGRVDRVAALEWNGDRVGGEVAVGEVLLDRVALERRDVHREAVVARHHRAPGAELLREPEGRGVDPPGDRLRGPRRVALDGEVEIARAGGRVASRTVPPTIHAGVVGERFAGGLHRRLVLSGSSRLTARVDSARGGRSPRT